MNIQDVVASAMSVIRTRVNTIASNLANAETTRTPEGGPYKRRDVVQIAQSEQSVFESTLDEMSLAKPSVQAVVTDQTEPRLVYQPGHPDANPDGYVAYPNINVVQTMTDLMTATRLYEANVSVLKANSTVLRAAKEIGGNI